MINQSRELIEKQNMEFAMENSLKYQNKTDLDNSRKDNSIHQEDCMEERNRNFEKQSEQEEKFGTFDMDEKGMSSDEEEKTEEDLDDKTLKNLDFSVKKKSYFEEEEEEEKVNYQLELRNQLEEDTVKKSEDEGLPELPKEEVEIQEENVFDDVFEPIEIDEEEEEPEVEINKDIETLETTKPTVANPFEIPEKEVNSNQEEEIKNPFDLENDKKEGPKEGFNDPHNPFNLSSSESSEDEFQENEEDEVFNINQDPEDFEEENESGEVKSFDNLYETPLNDQEEVKENPIQSIPEPEEELKENIQILDYIQKNLLEDEGFLEYSKIEEFKSFVQNEENSQSFEDFLKNVILGGRLWDIVSILIGYGIIEDANCIMFLRSSFDELTRKYDPKSFFVCMKMISEIRDYLIFDK